VAKLRKPSVAAWAVNQLVRTQPRDVDALLNAGDALQRAQTDLLAKRGDPSKLRKAVEAERAAVERLLEKARGLLDSDGHELTAPRLEQVTETLHAAALDEDARASVRDGCLERELRHVGIGSFGAVGGQATRRRPTGTRKEAGAARAPRPQKRDVVEERASRQERVAKERAARDAEATARRRLERASRQQRTAERRRERAAGELQDAEQELATAREMTDQAERDLKRATQLLDEL
jgi:hypothetical protein